MSFLNPASIIVFEGPDKVGKETQSKMLAFWLTASHNKKVAHREIPLKGGFLYSTIYWMLQNNSAKKYANLFQFIQFLNKFVFQMVYLWRLILTNDYVILDRWALSTIVYGAASGANKTFTHILNYFLFEPNITILLIGDSLAPPLADAYEKDTVLQANVRSEYSKWYVNNQDKCALVDNVGSRFEIKDRVFKILSERFRII